MTFMKNKKAEWIVFLVYLIGLIIISAFHEECFDETQAWEIARCASLKDILFKIPHYEGHPPLWHLLLVPFAKSGMPFKFSLHFLAILFSTSAMGLLIFKSPFPKPVRCLLPFTYFFFYQYGVVARPYSLMMLAIMLSAMTYTDRNQKPFRYILSLCLLCLTSAFGIMIAGCLCIVWTVEILSEMIKHKTLKFFWKDKRFYALCVILTLAMILMLTISPAEDCYYNGVDDNETLWNHFTDWKRVILWLLVSFDVWFGEYFSYAKWNVSDTALIMEMLGGIAFWSVMIPLLKKNKKFWTFFLPHTVLSCFMLWYYFSIHHIGILAMIHVMGFWMMMAQPEGMQIPDFMKKIWSSLNSVVLKKMIIGIGGIICMIPLVYTVVSVYHEVQYDYAPVRHAEFIKEHHLEDKKIMIAWKTKTDDEYADWYPTHYMPAPHAEIKANYTNIVGHGSTLSVYFDKNIFMNFNIDCPEDLYMHYQYKEDVQAVFAKWREQGLPDFILEYAPIDEVYDEDMLEEVEYVCIQEFEAGEVFKFNRKQDTHRIFIRKDLLDEYPQFHQLYP
ncbi:MAG: hypothetical protein IKP69_03510 [Oscillospiraceae bacterium]|nr:hypothetical protein [Oscillospiraceae bacterium]